MLQVDIYPIEPLREEAEEDEYDGVDVDSLFGRVVSFPDGRRVLIERYKDEGQLEPIMALIGRELSEPYSIYTYRYFIHYWPELCILARDPDKDALVGVVICKLEHQRVEEGSDYQFGQGYIAMLAVEESYRGMGLGTKLVRTVIRVMEERDCDEVVLETEVSNVRSLSLYGRIGFIRESRLFRYYLNGSDAFRLKLYLERPQQQQGRMEKNDQNGKEEEGERRRRIEDLQDGMNNHLHYREGRRREEEDEDGPNSSLPSTSTHL